MKITFLGTGYAIPTKERNCVCTMLEAGGGIYLINAGAPAAELLQHYGKKVTDIRAIFATHQHGDHVNGMIPLLDLGTWCYKQWQADIYLAEEKAVPVFQSMIETSLGRAFEGDRLRMHVVSEGLVYEDAFIRVTAYPTRHLFPSGRPSYAYLVEGEGKRILITGDLSHHLADDDMPSIAMEEPLDLMVTEMAHFTREEAAPTLNRLRVKELCFHHVPQDPAKEADFRALNGLYPYPVSVLRDGDIREW